MVRVALFEHINFRGAHKHVVGAEPKHALDDSFFNDRVSSIAALHNQWKAIRNSGFQKTCV
jgi:hypothetical protein